MRTIKDGLVTGESPRWHDGRLWLSDWGAREMLALGRDGRAEVVARVGALPFCFGWLPDGRLLVVADARDGSLRRESDGGFVEHADLTAIAPPPWNDIVVNARGNAYVGCTGFDFPGGEFAPGTVALVAADGSLREVADAVAFPTASPSRATTAP